MKKIIVIGCPGSGKSTFSLKLNSITGIPLYHLDNVWWRSDRTHITRDEFDEELADITSRDSWIIDGNYSRTYETRIAACDTVFFLDFDEDVCMQGIIGRIGFSYLLGFVLELGCVGFWFGDGIAGYMPFLVSAVFFISGRWKRNDSIIKK